MIPLIAPLVLIFLSLTLGYCYRRKALASAEERSSIQEAGGNGLSREAQINALRDRLQFVAFFLCMPLSAMLSLWGMKAPDARMLGYPLLGLATWILGGFFALLAAKAASLPPRDAGSLFCCGSFSNIGALGTLVAVFLFGEVSIAYAALFRLFEEIFYYGVAIPVASHFTTRKATDVRIQGIRITRLLLIVLSALATGVLLNRLNVTRPEIAGYLAAVLSVLACAMALFAIGLGLRLSQLARYRTACGIVCVIKFLLLPCCIGLFGVCTGFDSIDAGLPLKIAILLAGMPVAMNALVPPALLNLNLDLANACWIVSTLALAVVLPLCHLVVHPLLFQLLHLQS